MTMCWTINTFDDAKQIGHCFGDGPKKCVAFAAQLLCNDNANRTFNSNRSIDFSAWLHTLTIYVIESTIIIAVRCSWRFFVVHTCKSHIGIYEYELRDCLEAAKKCIYKLKIYTV